MQLVHILPPSLSVSGGRGDTVIRCALVMIPGPSLRFFVTFKIRLLRLIALSISRLFFYQTVWFVGITITTIVLCSMWMVAAWELLLELVMVASSGTLLVLISRDFQVIWQQRLTFCLPSFLLYIAVFSWLWRQALRKWFVTRTLCSPLILSLIRLPTSMPMLF